MTTYTFKTFAIVGPGASTEYIIDELLLAKQSDHAISVRVLSRLTSKPHAKANVWSSLGATFHPVIHETSHPSLKEALTGSDVVVSGIGITTPNDQVPLALTAKEAGVKLFLPFEYGADAENMEVKTGVYALKKAFRRWLEGEGGWKGRWIRFHTGWYADEIISDFIGFDIFDPSRPPKITIYGDGNTPICYTSRKSLGAFLGHALSHAPSSSLLSLAAQSPTANALRIEGGRLTTNELLSLCQSLIKVPENVPISRVSSQELDRQADVNPQDFRLDMLRVYDQGLGVTGSEVGGNWVQWRTDGWKPETVEQIVKEKLRRVGRLKDGQ